MSTNKKIKVTELDFDIIKENLKNFLKGQSEFQDYDFEGSAMAVLLDLLAYNTHYNAVYNNMAVNELFLDSASKRNSVVSIAKMLGYTPASAKCSSAIVNLTVSSAPNAPVGPSLVVLPAFSQFLAVIDGQTYTFYNRNAINMKGPGTVYTATNVVLTEGDILKYKYEVSPSVRYVIPNQNVDTSTLRIRVQENPASSNFDTYQISGSVVDITRDSKVYWLKEVEDNQYEVTFGDGILGKALEAGNIVHIDYMISSLDAPNGAKLFSYAGPTLYNGAIVSVSTVSQASGGALQEGLDSIKFNSPKLYAAQNRAVTIEDYRTIIYNNFPEAKSVSVWGGEDNDPPVYGKVFICVNPRSTATLTDQQKSNIVNTVLEKRNVVSVIPTIVDPEIFDIVLDVNVYYNPTATIRTAKDLEYLVLQTILQYNDEDLQRFDSIFRHSKLSRLIDLTETSIINNITTVSLVFRPTPIFNFDARYKLNIINPIYNSGVPEESVLSSSFLIDGSANTHYFDDDGVGNIRLYSIDSDGNKIVEGNIGTVNYAKGIIDIPKLNISAATGQTFEIYIKPQSYDVVASFNKICEIKPANITLNIIQDNTISGDTRAGNNYQFSSIRS